jgi:hypothetical protein
MMEEIIEKVEKDVDRIKEKFFGVTTGRVINVFDPLFLGRVQIQLQFVDSLDLSPWARVALPMAGILHGTYFLPNPGDEVLVAFEHGDINAPYVVGCLWTAIQPPPIPNPIAQIRMIRTPVWNQIIFTEVPPSITINTPTGQIVSMSAAGVQIVSDPKTIISMNPAGVEIVSGANVITMTPDGITIAGNPALNLVSSGSISITAPAVTIKGGIVAIN